MLNNASVCDAWTELILLYLDMLFHSIICGVTQWLCRHICENASPLWQIQGSVYDSIEVPWMRNDNVWLLQW